MPNAARPAPTADPFPACDGAVSASAAVIMDAPATDILKALIIETPQAAEFRQAVPPDLGAKIRLKPLPEGHDRTREPCFTAAIRRGAPPAHFAASSSSGNKGMPSMQNLALSLALLLAVLTWPPSAYAGETIQS